MSKFKIVNYILTFLMTTVIVVVLCFGIELELLFRSENKINAEELSMKNLIEFCTIEQLEKRLQKEPNNHLIHIKLAKIYESLGELKQAQQYYESALKVSSRSDYSLYSYSIFCAKNNLFALSATLAEELTGNNKLTIEYKARIYEKLGDAFLNVSQAEAATKAYQVAYKYAKNIESKKDLMAIQKKYSNSYIELADYNVSKDRIKEAISNLNNSNKIFENDLASYKLGLIYLNIDKAEAERYFSKVFKSSPFLVNPYIYNTLLSSLILDNKMLNEKFKADYYNIKLQNLIKKLKNIYIYKGDFIVDSTNIYTKKKIFDKELNYYITFNLRNNTNQKVDSLFLQLEIYINNKKYVLNKKIVSKTNQLDSFSVLESVKMRLPDNVQFVAVDKSNDVIVKYFLRKQKESPWTLVKIDAIDF